MGDDVKQHDPRPFYPIFLNRNPSWIAPMKGVMTQSVALRPIQRWTINAGTRVVTLCAVTYSQDKAQEIMKKIQTRPAMMDGPDMFHLIDEHGRLCVNVLQPVLQLNKVEI